MTMAVRQNERNEAIEHLRKLLKPGDTVYTVLRHVSRSGMSRGIDCYILEVTGGPCVQGHNNGLYARPVCITGYVGKAIERPQSRKDWENGNGLRISGCGMDMGFAIVYDLSRVLFRDDPKRGDTRRSDGDNRDAGYALNHKWL